MFLHTYADTVSCKAQFYRHLNSFFYPTLYKPCGAGNIELTTSELSPRMYLTTNSAMPTLLNGTSYGSSQFD
jgi:hypothetical protein